MENGCVHLSDDCMGTGVCSGPYRAGGSGVLKVKGKQQAWDLAGP